MFNRKANRIAELEKRNTDLESICTTFRHYNVRLLARADNFEKLYYAELSKQPKTVSQAYREKYQKFFPVKSPEYEAFQKQMQRISDMDLYQKVEQDQSEHFKGW